MTCGTDYIYGIRNKVFSKLLEDLFKRSVTKRSFSSSIASFDKKFSEAKNHDYEIRDSMP